MSSTTLRAFAAALCSLVGGESRADEPADDAQLVLAVLSLEPNEALSLPGLGWLAVTRTPPPYDDPPWWGLQFFSDGRPGSATQRLATEAQAMHASITDFYNGCNHCSELIDAKVPKHTAAIDRIAARVHEALRSADKVEIARFGTFIRFAHRLHLRLSREPFYALNPLPREPRSFRELGLE